MAEMVWCQSCEKVVWAYDHYPHTDIRGFLNEAYIPCPKCGKEGNFGGWGSNNAHEDIIKTAPNYPVYDDWSAMRAVAEVNKVEWCPSRDNRWFPEEVAEEIKEVNR